MVKCNRIDIISILEPHLKDYWEGEDETNGIYFDEYYGYAINKVFAVKMEHQDNVRPLFFITKEESVVEKIKDCFPYRNMKKRPQKRFLLFDKENLTPDELQNFFFVNGEKNSIDNDSIRKNNELFEKEFRNKRERQRLTAVLHLDKNKLKVIIERDSEKVRLIKSENMSKVNSANNKQKNSFVRLNANSLYYALKICESLVDVEVSKNESKILFEGLVKREGKISRVKVVVALVKGRG